MDDALFRELGTQLAAAWDHKKPIAPINESHGIKDIESAYRVQQVFDELRLASGDQVMGRKIGLTSKAVQGQLGVNQPDFGNLWSSRYFTAARGRVEVPADLFIAPRVEGELAFLIGAPLQGPRVTLQDVLVATEAVAYSIEIVDSRIADWRIGISDTVADNASYGGFCLSSWQRDLLGQDLRTLGMTLTKNGELTAQGAGAACLQHPARAVAWLANKLGDFGIGLQAGDIVMSGAWMPMVPVARGDQLLLETHGGKPLALQFV